MRVTSTIVVGHQLHKSLDIGPHGFYRWIHFPRVSCTPVDRGPFLAHELLAGHVQQHWEGAVLALAVRSARKQRYRASTDFSILTETGFHLSQRVARFFSPGFGDKDVLKIFPQSSKLLQV